MKKRPVYSEPSKTTYINVSSWALGFSGDSTSDKASTKVV